MDVANLGENVPQGISISNGPVMEYDTNGRRISKRKVRKPAIKEESESDSDAPLVSLPVTTIAPSLEHY